jgi:glutathione S-transferase
MFSFLDRHLGSNEYFGGVYAIADMTVYPNAHIHGVHDIGLKLAAIGAAGPR